MRAIISDAPGDLGALLRDAILPDVFPGCAAEIVSHVDQLEAGADVYIIVLNNTEVREDAGEAGRWDQILGRAAELQRQAAVFILAGYPDDAEERTPAAGLRRFFPLPFDVRALIDAIDEELARGQSKQPDGSLS